MVTDLAVQTDDLLIILDRLVMPVHIRSRIAVCAQTFTEVMFDGQVVVLIENSYSNVHLLIWVRW